MRSIVHLKTVSVSKPLLTHVTYVWPFTRVRNHVTFQTATLSKLLPTYVTAVWFFACVCKPVYVKIPALSECLATHVTFVQLVTRVCLYMCDEAAGCRKCLCARMTCKAAQQYRCTSEFPDQLISCDTHHTHGELCQCQYAREQHRNWKNLKSHEMHKFAQEFDL